jgi:hypothetical protein
MSFVNMKNEHKKCLRSRSVGSADAPFWEAVVVGAGNLVETCAMTSVPCTCV